MVFIFISDILFVDYKVVICQMKYVLWVQFGDVQQIFNQLSDDIVM